MSPCVQDVIFTPPKCNYLSQQCVEIASTGSVLSVPCDNSSSTDTEMKLKMIVLLSVTLNKRGKAAQSVQLTLIQTV